MSHRKARVIRSYSQYIKSACLVTVLSLMGCQSAQNSSQEKFDLVLKGHPQKIEKIDWHTSISTKKTGEDQISRNKIESMDFSSRVKTISANDKQINQEHVVTHKDGGSLNLNDMAFPELGEKLKVSYSTKGEVLLAGDYSKDSIFYVPPISLPKKPVSVGDSWSMESEWIDSKSSIKMKMQLKSVLKRTVKCGKKPCFDIEITGSVDIPQINEVMKMQSEIWGRILFSQETGGVIWSEIRNREKLEFPQNEILVETCLESMLRKPEIVLLEKKKPNCQVPFETTLTMPKVYELKEVSSSARK